MSKDTLNKYAHKWIALSPDRKKVIASAKTMLELNKKIQKTNIKEVIYHHVLPPNTIYAP